MIFMMAMSNSGTPDVQEIVDRNLRALGGVEKLKSISSRRVSGTMTAAGGAAQGPFAVCQKRPDCFHFRTELMGNVFIQAYDGKEAWQVQPPAAGGSGQPEPMAERQAEGVIQQAGIDPPLMDPGSGSRIDLVGQESIGEGAAYQLKLTRASGSETHYFIDGETYLLLKSVAVQFIPQVGAKAPVEQWMEDYRQVDGVQVPHKQTTQSGEMVLSSRAIERVEFNVDLDDSLFQRSPAS